MIGWELSSGAVAGVDEAARTKKMQLRFLCKKKNKDMIVDRAFVAVGRAVRYADVLNVLKEPGQRRYKKRL